MARIFKYIGPKGKVLDANKARRLVRQGTVESRAVIKKLFVRNSAGYQPKYRVIDQMQGDDRAVLGSDDERLVYVSEGTKAHVISADPGGALAFELQYDPGTTPGVIDTNKPSSGGDTVFAAEVQHPGSEPRKVPETVVQIAQPDVTAAYQRNLARLQS